MIDRLPDDATLHRVYSEFMEMPGLRLTPKQAQRLWGLDEHQCLQLLNQLVDAKFLTRGPQGLYGRSSDGPIAMPSPLPAKATLRSTPRPMKQTG